LSAGEPRGGRPLTARTRWLAITAATVVGQFVYWPVVIGTAALAEDGGATAGLIALGLALAPFAFAVLAFGSRHDRAPGATLAAMGLFLVIALPLGVVLGPVYGAAIGLAAGGVVTLRRPEAIATVRPRWLAVLALAIYLYALFRLAPGLGLFSAAVLPFALHGLVDQAVEGRHADRDRRDGGTGPLDPYA
jgi:hypothetical protein